MPSDSSLYETWYAALLPEALRPVRLRENPDVRYWPEVDDYTMSSGFAMTPKGRIWLAWFGGGDNSLAYLLLASSDDGGATFGKPRFVLDGGWLPHGIHIGSVVGNLWTDPLGRLWLFYMQSVEYFDGRGGTWAARCDNPDAEHPVWNDPVRIWHGCALNKPTVLGNGDWLLPINLWSREIFSSETRFRELDPERKTHVFVSRNQGESWEKRGSCVNPIDRTFDEPMVVERRDGSLLMLQRMDTGMTESVSSDGGYTWTEPVRFVLPAPSARFFFTRLRSGKLLLVKNHNPRHSPVRSHLTAFLSDDDGKNWYGGLLLDEQEGVSYPDGFEAPDGRIFIQYDWRRQSGEIRMAIFTAEDVAAGRPISGKTVLRHPIMQSRTCLEAARNGHA